MTAGASAMLLAAGLGTRLRPLTDELPKPLSPLGDRPVLEHLVTRLARAGHRRVVVNTHHLAEEFPSRVARFDAEIQLVHEPEIRGTAGGVAGARALFGEPPIVVWNADILADPPLAVLRDTAGQGLAFVVAPRPMGEGTVGLDDDERIVRLRGEVFGRERSGGDYLGIAALGAEVLASLPERGCLVGDVALPRLRRGDVVRAVRHEGRWSDIGTIALYHAENIRWSRESLGVGASWIHPSANVAEGVVLRECLVGEGAVVTGAGLLERVVAWPGARVTAPLSSAIVTTAGRVVPVG